MSTKILSTSEIATGVVNSINKSFQVSKKITTIYSVTMYGSEYSKYSFLGNKIILDEAPQNGNILVTYSYESNFDYLDNSIWITGEILSGNVDSSNKRFDAFYDIASIDEVRVNGLATNSYTTQGRSILLTNAPSVGYVEIDYFKKDIGFVDFQRDKYYTLSEVRGMVYDEIGQDETSVQYPVNLVNLAIQDGINELVIHAVDKSRYCSFTIQSAGVISVDKGDTTSTLKTTYQYPLPPNGRLMDIQTGNKIDYTGISNNKDIYIHPSATQPTDIRGYSVGYRLPRNLKRINNVYYKGMEFHQGGTQGEYLFGNSYYFVNNGYIYFKHNVEYTIEFELNEYAHTNIGDNIIYIDRDDISVIVYYTLRQIYQSRESDKLNSAAQLYAEKLKSYKRRMNKKRVSDKSGLMKTNGRLIPGGIHRGVRKNINRGGTQLIFVPDENIDGGYANSQY